MQPLDENSDHGAWRRFALRVSVGTIVYIVLAEGLELVVFLLSHIPSSAFSLDVAILPLARVGEIFLLPKRLLRALWPGEVTPGFLPWVLSAANGVIWGMILVGLHRGWRRLRGIRN